MELFALLLLLPMTWFGSDGAVFNPEVLHSSPRVEAAGGQLLIHPPEDPSLSMIVLEQKVNPMRAPSSLAEGAEPQRSERIIEVVVSAP